MLREKLVIGLVVVLAGTGMLNAAERVLVLKIGPTWPNALLKSEKPTAWDASVLAGLVVDRKIAFGGGVDFLWNTNDKADKISENLYRRISTERTFMFPVSGYLAITPIPDFMIHPCVSGQIGFNTMYYSRKEDATEAADTVKSFDKNGWYMGFFWKIAADAIYNLGEKSGLFAGIDFQWSKPEKINNDDDELIAIRNMSGIGIRMGLRVIY